MPNWFDWEIKTSVLFSNAKDKILKMEVLNVSQLDHEYRPRLQSLIDQYGIQQTEHQTIEKRVKKCIENLNLLLIVNTIIGFFPIIRCLKEYDLKKNLFGDFLSGLTIAVMHIPQGIAYAVLAGLPVACGLYVSLFPVFIYMIFGTCPHLSIGSIFSLWKKKEKKMKWNEFQVHLQLFHWWHVNRSIPFQ